MIYSKQLTVPESKRVCFALLLCAVLTSAANAFGDWPPEFSEPYMLMHGEGAEVGPLRVPANWPQVVLFDFDDDGDADLLINQPQRLPNLLFRNVGQWHEGAPVFAPPTEVSLAPGAIGDLDGDGSLEIVTAARGTESYRRHSLSKTGEGYKLKELSLIEASGKQHLRPPLAGGVEPTIRILDVDRDGKNDLVVGIRQTGYSSPLRIEPPGGWGWPASFSEDGTWLGNDSLGAVVWHKNVGESRFTVGKPLRIGDARLPLFTFDDAACEVVDLDGDDNLELLVCSFDRLLWFRFAEVKGEAVLKNPFVLKVGGQERLPYQRLGVTASDLDDDGRVDLILYGPGFLFFAKNQGGKPPEFASLKEVLQANPAVAVDGFAVPAVTDLNADGHPDLVVGTEDGFIRYFENAGSAKSFQGPIFFYDGDRYTLEKGPVAPMTFKPGRYLQADERPIRITTGHNLTGPLEELWGYAGPVPVDWDGDKDTDLLVGSIGPFIMYYENIGDPSHARFESRGKLHISGEGELPNGYRVRPAVITIKGDAHPSLLAIDQSGRLMLHRRSANSPATTLQAGIPVPAEDGKPVVAVGGEGRLNGRSILSAVDWDEDGDWDLVAGMRASGERLRYFENVGTSQKPRLKYIGGFPVKRPGGHYQMAEFWDFDQDGKLDVVAGSDQGFIYYFRQKP